MKRSVLIGLVSAGLALARAADAPPAAAPDSYRLMIRDQISVSVYDEPELAAAPSIDATGSVRLPLLEDVNVSGLTVREAEKKLERLFVEKELLKKPMVTIRIASYAPREIKILGAVRNPGLLSFPPEIASMDIVEAITKVGGFGGIAVSNKVQVTRQTAKGEEKFVVNVKRMIEGGSGATEHFLVYPGDQIYVDDRLL